MKTPIGNCPKESQKISKFRKHQGWWRTFVLNEPEGEYLDQQNKLKKTVCNRINRGKESRKNFLSQEILDSVEISIKFQPKNLALTGKKGSW